MIAAEKNNYEIVKILLDEGIDFNKKVDGFRAIDKSRSTSYKYLLEAEKKLKSEGRKA